MTALELRVGIEAGMARGLARLSRTDLETLGLRAGDTVRVSGRDRATHARAIPADRRQGMVGLDRQLAGNAGLAEDDAALVARCDLPPLDSVLVRALGAQPSVTDLSDALFDMALSAGDRVQVALPPGQCVALEIAEAAPAPAGLFRADTVVSLAPDPSAPEYAGVGGLKEQIARVHEMVAVPLSRPELYDALGLPAPRGILFTGPPGSGKTLLARAVAERTQAAFFHLNAPEIMSRHYGDSEAALRRVFEEAARRAPAIVFIDEIDAIAPRRDVLSGDRQLERRVVAQLLTLLDGLTDRGRVVVMAATNLPDSLDPALRRPGRLDRELVFRPPAPRERAEILRVHMARTPLAPDADLDAVAVRAEGYVGADLAALAREAAISALNRAIAEAGDDSLVVPASLAVGRADLERGLAATGPSVLRGTGETASPVRWADIGGARAVRTALERAIVWPRLHRDVFADLGLEPARGVLLTGPPGVGKTFVARALAAESGMNFVSVRGAHLLSQFLGEAERAVGDLFRRARDAAPAILFFDEIDTLAPRRSGRDRTTERLLAELLVELDGVSRRDDIIVLAATNRAGAIDPALLRAGRFDEVIRFRAPDTAARADILRVHLRARAVSGDIDPEAIAGASEGLTGADIAAIVRDAARLALVRSIEAPGERAEIRHADLDRALARLRAGMADRSADTLRSSEGADVA